jgi:hypothetical protein
LDVVPLELPDCFFKGTYDTPGVSHVGIYVGNNRMIHCGNPISYTIINTQYWQSHFYSLDFHVTPISSDTHTLRT